jgi:trk system potassium uptake protein
MINFKFIFHIVGTIIIGMSCLMLLPLAVDMMDHHINAESFWFNVGIGFFIGLILYLATKKKFDSITSRDAILMAIITWTIIPLYASLPFLTISESMTFTNAFFEAVSGLATCGSTAIAHVEEQSRGILLWRSLLNWVGGIGILVIAMLVLPTLRIAGTQIFKLESSESSDKILPRAINTAWHIIFIYSIMTAICFILLLINKLDWFDAICHSMSAIATGGFSTKDSSIGFFNNGYVEIIIIVTMILGSLPFSCYIKIINKDFSILQDAQIQYFLSILAIAILSNTLWMHINHNTEILQTLKDSAFNMTSVITTTGFSTSDYTYHTWGGYTQILLFVLSVIGGCSGSTTGGIKIFRLQVVLNEISNYMNYIIHPHGIFKNYYNDKPISSGAITGVLILFIVYLMTMGVGIILISFAGFDFQSSFATVVASLSCSGYGLGDNITPHGSYADVSDFVKWVCMSLMIIGRLEFFTVFVIFTRSFWLK